MLYCCFTAALLLLYYCFTAALLLLYCCFTTDANAPATHALYHANSCFPAAALLLLYY
jgi:hypothetical protein